MKFDDLFLKRVEDAIRNGHELNNSFLHKSLRNVVLWLDLLGFQNQLFSDKKTAMLRISVFHEITLESVSKHIHIAQLNDATVMSVDFSENDDPKKLTDFLVRCDVLLETSTRADKTIGGYGTRGVISIGNRQNLRGNFGGRSQDLKLTLDKITFSSPIPIMMNMAFAKSYQVESSGLLLKEPSLYVEKCILSDYKDKIEVSPEWKHHGQLDFKGNEYVLVRRDKE